MSYVQDTGRDAEMPEIIQRLPLSTRADIFLNSGPVSYEFSSISTDYSYLLLLICIRATMLCLLLIFVLQRYLLCFCPVPLVSVLLRYLVRIVKVTCVYYEIQLHC